MRDGAASSIFVKGSLDGTILCTLPNAHKPTSSVVSHQPPIPSVSPEILAVVDDGLTQYLNSKGRESVPPPFASQALPTQQQPMDPSPPPALPEGFRVGDLVKLKASKAMSSLGEVEYSEVVTLLLYFYCGVNFIADRGALAMALGRRWG